MMLNAEQQNRALGVMLGLASGDALGAGYEFCSPKPDHEPVDMIGGGLGDFAPGEWTDDTSMAIVIAQALQLSGGKLNDESKQEMTKRWSEWVFDAPDAGNQTRAVFAEAENMATRRGGCEPTIDDLLKDTEIVHNQVGKSGGNGSLMRTAPVALAYLHSAEEAYNAAFEISALTHFEFEAGEACGLWTVAIRHAILTGDMDIRVGLGFLPPARAALWEERIAEAENKTPRDFPHNGWVVQALQGAWSAIHTTSSQLAYGADHLIIALEAAVRGGVDTDTVAAIAGSLIGAAYGMSSFSDYWMTMIHGWPGMTSKDLVDMSLALLPEETEADVQASSEALA